jgi:hypothetical protein
MQHWYNFGDSDGVNSTTIMTQVNKATILHVLLTLGREMEFG